MMNLLSFLHKSYSGVCSDMRPIYITKCSSERALNHFIIYRLIKPRQANTENDMIFDGEREMNVHVMRVLT